MLRGINIPRSGEFVFAVLDFPSFLASTLALVLESCMGYRGVLGRFGIFFWYVD